MEKICCFQEKLFLSYNKHVSVHRMNVTQRAGLVFTVIWLWAVFYVLPLIWYLDTCRMLLEIDDTFKLRYMYDFVWFECFFDAWSLSFDLSYFKRSQHVCRWLQSNILKKKSLEPNWLTSLILFHWKTDLESTSDLLKPCTKQSKYFWSLTIASVQNSESWLESHEKMLHCYPVI